MEPDAHNSLKSAQGSFTAASYPAFSIQNIWTANVRQNCSAGDLGNIKMGK